jgi:hypothetical protein
MISYRLTRQIAVVLTSVALIFGISPAVKAQKVQLSPSQTQQVVNALSYPTSSQRFFEEGQRKFEKEIDSLSKGKFPPPESILQISDDLLEQGQLSPTEKLPILSQEVKTKG